jgi:ABC-type antimicrobial peptide transport system permease subunit
VVRSVVLARPDFRVVAVTAIIAAIVMLTFVASSAIQSRGAQLSEELRGGFTSSRMTPHTLLVALQVALAVVLLYASSLMIRTFINLRAVALGFNPNSVLAFDIDTRKATPSANQLSALAPALLSEVSDLACASSASFAAAGIMKEIGLRTRVSASGSTLPIDQGLNTSINIVSSSYFTTLGIPLLTGTIFAPDQPDTKPLSVVVNRAFVNHFIPDRRPIGHLLTSGTGRQTAPDAIIIGVVATSKYRSLREPDEPTYYAPIDYKTLPKLLTLYVRYKGSESVARASVISLIDQTLGPYAILRVTSLDADISDSLWRERLMTYLAGAVGFTALMLVILGLYGCVQAATRYHARDTGVRIALGASRQEVTFALFNRVIFYFACGGLVGALASFVVGRLAQHFLFGINPIDPLSLTAALFLIGLFSVAIMIRASGLAWMTDPAATLRSE